MHSKFVITSFSFFGKYLNVVKKCFPIVPNSLQFPLIKYSPSFHEHIIPAYPFATVEFVKERDIKYDVLGPQGIPTSPPSFDPHNVVKGVLADISFSLFIPFVPSNTFDPGS